MPCLKCHAYKTVVLRIFTLRFRLSPYPRCWDPAGLPDWPVRCGDVTAYLAAPARCSIKAQIRTGAPDGVDARWDKSCASFQRLLRTAWMNSNRAGSQCSSPSWGTVVRLRR
ncbi:hypothetical protein CHARACLAT_001827 [Characodon lateralis]|uniref:Uncharacterized protein n=1 Tax=Characodon lateralis TaxID=208331 RepID=A0ABU7DPU5_9TELE|nr:hypothetical protein [Characodon lateralis]